MEMLKAVENTVYSDACLDIARALPDYFTGAALAEMQNDLLKDRLYLAVDSGVLAFATAGFISGAVAEITWMAVRPGRRNRGIGTDLLRFLAADLKAQGFRLLQVKTLAEEAGYRPYEPTRRFYEKTGFLHLETIDPYPPWGPGNPCAIYVKVL